MEGQWSNPVLPRWISHDKWYWLIICGPDWIPAFSLLQSMDRAVKSSCFPWDICFQFCKHWECGYFCSTVMKAWHFLLHVGVNYKSSELHCPQQSSQTQKPNHCWSLLSHPCSLSHCQLLFEEGRGRYFKMFLLASEYKVSVPRSFFPRAR